jgi:hypothetical protein
VHVFTFETFHSYIFYLINTSHDSRVAICCRNLVILTLNYVFPAKFHEMPWKLLKYLIVMVFNDGGFLPSHDGDFFHTKTTNKKLDNFRVQTFS